MCVRILIDIVIIKYSSLIQINTNTKHIHKANTKQSCAILTRLSLTIKCTVHHTNTNIEANNVCQNTHTYSYHQILFSHTNKHTTKLNKQYCTHTHKQIHHAQYLQPIIDHKVYSPSYKYKYRRKQCVSEYSQIQLSSNTLLSYKSTQN